MDRRKIRNYWNNNVRSNYLVSGAPSTIELLSTIRHVKESQRFRELVKDKKRGRFLELGCGSGRYTLDFYDFFRDVVAVDFAQNQILQLEKELRKRKVKNVNTVVKDVLDLELTEKFDVIFLSGLTQYLNDRQLKTLLKKLKKATLRDGLLISRDSLNLGQSVETSTMAYDSIYRSFEKFLSIFRDADFECQETQLSYFFIYDDVFRRLGMKRLNKFYYIPLFTLEPLLLKVYKPVLHIKKGILRTSLNPYHIFSVWKRL